jgi:DedD protein
VVTQAEPAPAEKSVAKPEPRSVKPEAKPEAKADIKKVEAPKPAAENRYVVQVGSFAEETRAREARAKLERAGLKNYTQAVETKDGKRIRVRAGPFASKAEAERAAEKIKKLDLPASVLSL